MTKTISYINCLLCIINLISINLINLGGGGGALVPGKAVPEKDDDFFTAASDMNLLLRVEDKLGRGLVKYIEKESKKLQDLEMELDKIDRQHASKNKEWVSQVTNGYALLKRFSNFWPSLKNNLLGDKTSKLRESLSNDLVSLEGAYPSENDLRGALTAIARIQRTYNITAKEFVNGLNSVSHKLNVQEIFQMGFLWSELGDYFHSREWLLQAAKHFPKNKTRSGFLEKSTIYEYLAWAEYMMLNVRAALKHTRRVLKLKPRHPAANANLKIFKEYERKLEAEGKNGTDQVDVAKTMEVKKPNITWETGKHNALCRGELKMPTSEWESLYCYYGVPRAQFLLKPLKVEQLYHDPNITLFHNFLSEWEMKYLKRRSAPYLTRATVHDISTGNLTVADYRVSKSAWIRPEEDKAVARLYQRVEHITGLDTRSYEPLQIANYGMAGQYEPHYDHATKMNPKAFDTWGGNRLATILMYLTDVEWGGKTIFTKTGPGVEIKPSKGAAVFWYNLKRSGESDDKTEHAACPVILGQKWTSNIWIHERYQEFIRPCGLNRDE